MTADMISYRDKPTGLSCMPRQPEQRGHLLPGEMVLRSNKRRDARNRHPGRTSCLWLNFPAAPEAFIDPFAQFLAGFEMRHMLCRQSNRIARFRISADPWRAIVQRETAEPPDLDTLSGRKCLAHLLKQALDLSLIHI